MAKDIIERAADALELALKVLPEEISEDDARNHPKIRKLICMADEIISGRTPRRTMEIAKTIGF